MSPDDNVPCNRDVANELRRRMLGPSARRKIASAFRSTGVEAGTNNWAWRARAWAVVYLRTEHECDRRLDVIARLAPTQTVAEAPHRWHPNAFQRLYADVQKRAAFFAVFLLGRADVAGDRLVMRPADFIEDEMFVPLAVFLHGHWPLP